MITAPAPTRLVLGTLHLRQHCHAAASAVLDAFLEAGGRTFDLATLYGGLHLLRDVGAHLRATHVRVEVLLKVGYFAHADDFADDDRWLDHAARAHDACDLDGVTLMLHEADWALWWRGKGRARDLCTAEDVPAIARRWPRLSERVRQRFGRPLGVSGNHAPALATVLAGAGGAAGMTVLVAKQLDLLWRSAEPLLDSVLADGGRVVLGAPWHQGWLRDLARLAQEYPDAAGAARELSALCERAGWSVADAAVPFLLRHAPESLIAFGAATPNEVHQAFDNLARPLPEALYDAIVALGAHRPPMGPLIPFESN